MSTLLTKQELECHILDFRELLAHFDYSSLRNVTFLNLDAFYAYMENVKGNPFELQYNALQEELDYIQPYLPFTSGVRASEFMAALNNAANDDEVTTIKKIFTKKLRDDFIAFSRTATTDDQWRHIIDTCEQIRQRKEEMLLALS